MYKGKFQSLSLSAQGDDSDITSILSVSIVRVSRIVVFLYFTDVSNGGGRFHGVTKNGMSDRNGKQERKSTLQVSITQCVRLPSKSSRYCADQTPEAHTMGKRCKQRLDIKHVDEKAYYFVKGRNERCLYTLRKL